jgi:hypothetical protein
LAGGELWALAEDRPEHALGLCMILARRTGSARANLVVEEGEGALARRAAAFADPPRVWRAEGRGLHEAVPLPAEPLREAPPEALGLAKVILAAGAEPVVEGGVLRAEVLGLEVGAVTGDGGEAVLEVGVGRHDREAHRVLHGDHPPAKVLASAVREVRRHRRAGLPSHPANQLSPERWLRAVVVERPQLAGFAEAVPIGTYLELAAPCPAPALARDAGGRRVLAVFSVGVDLDLVPVAAEVRASVAASAEHGRDAPGRQRDLVLVVPEGDDHPAMRQLAAELLEPAEVRTVAAGWKDPPDPRA